MYDERLFLLLDLAEGVLGAMGVKMSMSLGS